MNERLVSEVVRRVVHALEARGELPADGAPAAGGRPAVAGGVSSARAAPPGGTLDAGQPTGIPGLPADWPPRRVAIGADHGGFEMKEDLRRYLDAKGFAIVDCGTHSKESVDYPDFAARVAQMVAGGNCQAGIVIDGAGIGSGMAANKVRGVRCAVCHDIATVLNSREHNDANVLSLGAGVVPMALARRMVSLWLGTACAGGRHLKRVRKILEIES